MEAVNSIRLTACSNFAAAKQSFKKKKGEAPSGLLLLLIQVYCRSEQRRCEFKTTTKHNAKCPPPLQKKRILNSINVAALQAGKKRIYEHKKVQQHM